MPITIDGDSGISGVNGTAGTPALQGEDSNTGIVFGTDTVQVSTGGSTRATVDSSGDIYVGGTTDANADFVFEAGTRASFYRTLFFGGSASGSANASIAANGTAEFSQATAANTAKMWINFNGTGTVAIRDSFNVASITDNGTGDYTISFTNAMPNNNYCVVASSGSTAGITLYNSSPQTGSVRIDSVNYTGANEDNAQQHVAVFAD